MKLVLNFLTAANRNLYLSIKRLWVCLLVCILVLAITPQYSLAQYQASEHICPQCWVSMQQILNNTPIFSEAQILEGAYHDPAEKNAILIFPSQSATSLRDYQNMGLRTVLNRLNQSKTGSSLLKKALQNKIQLDLYYQLNLDQNLQNHMAAGKTTPTYILEKSDIHELWSFYSKNSENHYIYLNEYQTVDQAVLSLAHELVHLLDAPSADYLAKYNSQWNDLDYFSLEYRAISLEIQVYKELKELGLLQSKNSTYDKILANKINLQSYLLQLLFPTGQQKLSLDSFEQSPCTEWDSLNKNQTQNCTLESESASPIDILPQVAERSKKSSSQFVSYLIKYRKNSQTSLQPTVTLESLFEIANQRSQFKSLLEYFESEGLLSNFNPDLDSKFKNTHGAGPSPRIGGGDRLLINHKANTHDSKIPLRKLTLEQNEFSKPVFDKNAKDKKFKPMNPDRLFDKEKYPTIKPEKSGDEL